MSFDYHLNSSLRQSNINNQYLYMRYIYDMYIHMTCCSEYDLSYSVHIIHPIPSTTKSSKKHQADDLDMAPEAEAKAPRVSHG